MRIQRLQATFGRLQEQSLDLSPGLNILHAPNETGKSTWCAFVLAMLYGINSRERDKAGYIAEKNRYAPWNGTPMSGLLSCTHNDQAITLVRNTHRFHAPMGHFEATTTDTANAIPWLTSQNCGQELLGVSRDVYERSGFIRQAGLGIRQTAELEQRITSLMTTGEETTSYTQAMEDLRRQLNRRRYNKTGEIPQLEAQMQGIRTQLQGLAQLDADLDLAKGRLAQLERQRPPLEHQLRQWDAYIAQQKQDLLDGDKDTAKTAVEYAQTLQRALMQDHVPENDTIARLRGAIVNLQTTRRSVEKAMAEKDQALRTRANAEERLAQHAFAGMTPEQGKHAAKFVPSEKKPNLLVPIVLGAVVGGGMYMVTEYLVYGVGAGAAVLLALGLVALLGAGKSKRKAMTSYLKHHGVSSVEALADLAETYTQLYAQNEAAEAQAAAATATYDGLYSVLTASQQGILIEVRRFAPEAFDVAAADLALRTAASRRKALQSAQETAREAQLRYELQVNPQARAVHPDRVAQPPLSQEALVAQLHQVEDSIIQAQRSVTLLEGQFAASTDGDVLRGTLAKLEASLAVATQQYNAITLAMDALTKANTELQNRFAPQLGKSTADIFTALTQGRYGNVVLDKQLHLSAQLDGSPLYRDVSLLSAGAADQLYLAVRLAICDWLLPPDAPIILDDALTNFDDQRCEIALDYLHTMAQTRQILLFSCHGREAQWAKKYPDISTQQLT